MSAELRAAIGRRHPDLIMLTSVAALACSLLVRPAARLSSPQMSTEERVEQLVDWVPAAAVPPLTVHAARLTLFLTLTSWRAAPPRSFAPRAS